MSYHFRRLDQVRTWFGQHRKTLPAQAEIAIAELLAMIDTADECIRKQLSEITQLKARDNPDVCHEAFQRDGHQVDMVFRRHRNQWEER